MSSAPMLRTKVGTWWWGRRSILDSEGGPAASCLGVSSLSVFD